MTDVETTESRAVRGRAAEVGALYDQMDRDTLHFGYWDGEDDDRSFEDAADRLSDLVFDRLELRGGDRVLDVGSGTGTPALRLVARTDASVVGVTVSGGQLAAARRRADESGAGDRLTFLLEDALELPFADDSFDCAFALESIEHMDRAAALREMARVVRPGGRVVVTDLFRRAPAPPDGPPVLDQLVPMWLMTEPPVLSDYPALVAGAGLHAVEIRDITEHVVRRSFADVLRRMTEAFAAGDLSTLDAESGLDLRLPEHQQAVLWFTGHLVATREVGYALLSAVVEDAPSAHN